MELRGGVVATRILGELWTAKAVDTATAVWLIDRILVPSAPEAEQLAAADLLAIHAAQLVPAPTDSEQEFIGWPRCMDGRWPTELPDEAQSSLIHALLRTLTARDLPFWEAKAAWPPMDALIALWKTGILDPVTSAFLRVLVDTDVSKYLSDRLSGDDLGKVRMRATEYKQDNVTVDQLISILSAWAKGEKFGHPLLSNTSLNIQRDNDPDSTGSPAVTIIPEGSVQLPDESKTSK